jgi:hypothetical protein
MLCVTAAHARIATQLLRAGAEAGAEGVINDEFTRLSVKRYLKARSQAVLRASMQ